MPVTFAWHVHHDKLVEPLVEPIEARIEYIKKNKAANEIDTRLRLLKPVVGKLPHAALEAIHTAWVAYNWVFYNETGEVYIKALGAYNKALAAYADKINALHATECPDCPWDGKTIFP